MDHIILSFYDMIYISDSMKGITLKFCDNLRSILPFGTKNESAFHSWVVYMVYLIYIVYRLVR